MQVIIVSASFSTLLDSWFVRDKSHLGHRQKVHFGRAIPLWDSIGNGFFTLPRVGLWLFYNHYFPNFEYIFRRFEERASERELGKEMQKIGTPTKLPTATEGETCRFTTARHVRKCIHKTNWPIDQKRVCTEYFLPLSWDQPMFWEVYELKMDC